MSIEVRGRVLISFDSIKFEVKNLNNITLLNFFFSERKYTEISLDVKTTFEELISNTGDILSLFLELTLRDQSISVRSKLFVRT